MQLQVFKHFRRLKELTINCRQFSTQTVRLNDENQLKSIKLGCPKLDMLNILITNNINQSIETIDITNPLSLQPMMKCKNLKELNITLTAYNIIAISEMILCARKQVSINECPHLNSLIFTDYTGCITDPSNYHLQVFLMLCHNYKPKTFLELNHNKYNI